MPSCSQIMTKTLFKCGWLAAMAEGGLEGRRRCGSQVFYDDQDSYSGLDGWLQWQRAGKRVEENVVHKFCYDDPDFYSSVDCWLH